MAAPFFCYCGSKFLLFLKTVPRADFKPSIFQNRQLENIFFFSKIVSWRSISVGCLKTFVSLRTFWKICQSIMNRFSANLWNRQGGKMGLSFSFFFMTLVVRLLKLGLCDFSLKSSLSAKPVQEKNITTMRLNLVLMIFHMSVNS